MGFLYLVVVQVRLYLYRPPGYRTTDLWCQVTDLMYEQVISPGFAVCPRIVELTCTTLCPVRDGDNDQHICYVLTGKITTVQVGLLTYY